VTSRLETATRWRGVRGGARACVPTGQSRVALLIRTPRHRRGTQVGHAGVRVKRRGRDAGGDDQLVTRARYRPIREDRVRDQRNAINVCAARFFGRSRRTHKAGGRALDRRTWDELAKVRIAA